MAKDRDSFHWNVVFDELTEAATNVTASGEETWLNAASLFLLHAERHWYDADVDAFAQALVKARAPRGGSTETA